MSQDLESDRCEGCGEFHQELFHNERTGKALCEECDAKEEAREDGE